MKNKYIFAVLFMAFVAGSLVSGLYVYSKFRVNRYTQWGIYMSTSLKFSIEYPKNLALRETFYETYHNDGSATIAGGLVELKPFPSIIPVVEITVSSFPGPKEWISAQPVEKYWASPAENRSGARIYHGEKLYSINIQNLNPQDADRMIKSIKFLE